MAVLYFIIKTTCEIDFLVFISENIHRIAPCTGETACISKHLDLFIKNYCIGHKLGTGTSPKATSVITELPTKTIADASFKVIICPSP